MWPACCELEGLWVPLDSWGLTQGSAPLAWPWPRRGRFSPIPRLPRPLVRSMATVTPVADLSLCLRIMPGEKGLHLQALGPWSRRLLSTALGLPSTLTPPPLRTLLSPPVIRPGVLTPLRFLSAPGPTFIQLPKSGSVASQNHTLALTPSLAHPISL